MNKVVVIICALLMLKVIINAHTSRTVRIISDKLCIEAFIGTNPNEYLIICGKETKI